MHFTPLSGLTGLDYLIVFGALVLMLVIGICSAKVAGQSLDHYFLGGRRLPWYVLGVSGMSGWFDLTGTMIITSFLFMMGPLGLYIEFRGGAVLALAFMLAFANKWGRRSGCMTYAEWNTFRFGTGASAELVRIVTAAIGILLTIGVLGYLVRGSTLFMGLMFPVDPIWLTLAIFAFASIYTVVAGFYGMVLTDLLQGCIMICSSIVMSYLALHRVPDAETLAAAALKVTGNPHWIAAAPVWHIPVPPGYEAYRDLMMAALLYLARSVLGGMAGGAVGGTHPLAFAARNPREASMMCLIQGLTIMFRWPLMISFAILGLLLVSRTAPDSTRLVEAAQLIRIDQPELTDQNWHEYTSRIAYHPQLANPELVSGLERSLGPNWRITLLVLGYRGNINPELIVPAVMLSELKPGLRGLLLAALLSALMGGLSSQINSTSALFVRDIYQNVVRPKARNRELLLAAYLSSIGIVIAGFAVGLHASSINELWGWLIMSLIAGTMGPTFLRLYWWRTNAWGMASGLVMGGTGAFVQRTLCPSLSEGWQFALMSGLSFAATIVGSLLTKPAPVDVVGHFYTATKPFGIWRPFFDQLPADSKKLIRREHRNDLITVVVGLVWQVCLLLLPMEILTRNSAAVWVTLPIFAAACVGLYYFWWKNLPAATEEVIDFRSGPP